MSAPTIPTDAQRSGDCQPSCGVGGPNSHGAHVSGVSQSSPGAVGSAPAEPPSDNATANTAAAARPAQTPPATPNEPPAAIAAPVSLADPFLALSADVLDDLEKVRIANENRLRQLTRTGPDEDGVERGFGLDESHRDVARVAALVETLAASEHQATLNLNRHMRAHPLGAWVAATPGVGEKQAARLLASIGDPAWNDATETWRTLRQLYSYCGYGDAAEQVRRRGVKSNWDATAKMRTYLVAVSCVKVGRGPLRAVYDEGRARYDGATHEAPCVRCGPSGHPAQPGTALSAGHQHARAVRLVCKAILRDLWREARRLHGFDDETDGA